MPILAIYNNTGEIGTIQYSDIETKTNYETDELTDILSVKIIWVDVNEDYQGKGIGNLLIICMISLIKYNNKKLEITLDDCSPRSGYKNCIYFKLGFRHLSKTTGDMYICINHKPDDEGYTYNNEITPEPINSFSSVVEFLNTLEIRSRTIDETYKFILDGKDVTEGIKRRLKTLNLIDYHQRNTFGKISDVDKDIKYLSCKIKYKHRG